jgi:type IV secretion system protein VirB1
MPIDLAPLVNLAAACAPSLDQGTLLSVVKVESGFEPLAIGVNTTPSRRLAPASREQAIDAASKLLAAGANIDLGLGQINSRNLTRLGLTVSDVFDPCINLAMSAKIIIEGYGRSSPRPGQERQALLTALSLYNTGHPRRGFENGYVARVVSAAGQLAPAIAAIKASASEPMSLQPPIASPAWDVFADRHDPSIASVFSPAQPTGVFP